MAEVIIPPEETEPELPEEQLPQGEKPTEKSKVISVEFNPLNTKQTTNLDTHESFFTTDSDAWIVLNVGDMNEPTGQYSLALINKEDGSIFQRVGDIVKGIAYYKLIPEEIKHAGRWVGQVVVTLENGQTTTSRFNFNVSGHLLDGKDVREIVIQDFQTLMKQLNDLKNKAGVDIEVLKNSVEETNRLANENELLRVEAESVREDAENARVVSYDSKVDAAIVATDINSKVGAKVAELSPTIQKVTAQLAQTDTKINRPKETKTLHLAHRGMENLTLENTLLAFEYAGQMGFDGIEIDVQDSLDGILYIMHDDTVDRTTNGTGSISSMTSTQIDNLLVDSGAYISLYPNTKIPTLEQTLLIAKKWNMIVFMELKKISQTASYQKIVDIIIQLNMIESVVVIGSIASVLEMKKIESTIEYGCFLDSFSDLENAKPLLPYAHVSLEKGQITKQGIADSHNMGFKVNAWTLNYNESDLSQTFKDYGIDYITGTVML